MSTNNYILNLLNIKDKNIHILTDKLSNRVIKGKKFQITEAILIILNFVLAAVV